MIKKFVFLRKSIFKSFYSLKYFYGLNQNISLQETGSASQSANIKWWLNSGGYFNVVNGIGKTIMGMLPVNDVWRTTYASSNPVDTDNGYHPQNIFRLVATGSWKNLSQEMKLNGTCAAS